MTDSSTEFRYAELHRYATFAKAVYGDVLGIRRTHGDSATVSEGTGSRVQWLVVNDPEEAAQWIAVRGTFNPRNVLVNGRMKVSREPRLGAYFHSGFLRAVGGRQEPRKSGLKSAAVQGRRGEGYEARRAF